MTLYEDAETEQHRRKMPWPHRRTLLVITSEVCFISQGMSKMASKPLNAEEEERGRHGTFLILDICITLRQQIPPSRPSVWSFIIAVAGH